MIKLHLKYTLNKFNTWTILIVTSIYLMGLLFNIFSIPSNMSNSLARDMYFYNLFSVLKIIVLLLIVLLMTLSSTSNNDQYQLFLIDKRVLRIKCYLTKIGSYVIISFVIVFIYMILYIIVGLLFTSWYVIRYIEIAFFVKFWLISFMYGLVGYNLVKMVNSLITCFIPCIILIIEEAFIGNEIIKYSTYFFPIFENSEKLSYGIEHVIVLITIYLIIGLIKSYIEDIK